MSFIGKTWNGKIIGFPAFSILFINRSFEIINDKITTFLISKNLCSVGKNVKILSGFKYRYPRNIILGNNVEIGSNVIFSSEISSGKIVIRDNVVIGRNSRIDFSGDILIEQGVILSEGVIIQTHDHGNNPRCNPIGKSLVLKQNVWLGLNSTVLSNTRIIGVNSILAANSVATKEIKEYSIYAGIPAKRLKENYSGK